MRLSLRWRLILVSWSLAVGTALVLTLLIHSHTRHQLLTQLESTLESKCDEVITVLTSNGFPMEEFLVVETRYRFSPYEYFYQIGDASSGVLARSRNLGAAELPAPDGAGARAANEHRLETVPHPLSPDDRIRLRSERVSLSLDGRPAEPVLIQTGVSLAPFEAAVSETQRAAHLVAAAGLAAVLFLLWFATTRSLQPVAAMTVKASQITASRPRERLPLAGRDDELDRLAKVLNDMLDRLAGSLRQMEQFSADAAHQLRTPLTRIQGELDLILRGGGLPGPLQRDLERIQDELDRLGRLCGRLLLFARLDRDGEDSALLLEVVELEPLVGELIEQLTPLALEQAVSLRYDGRAGLHVRGSRALLVEALFNLIDNAIRVAPEGSEVRVSISIQDGRARIAVADIGPGVPPEARELVFQPFSRLPDQAGRVGEGAGLGLPIASGIARAHGGDVVLESPPHGGSVFSLVLPLHS